MFDGFAKEIRSWVHDYMPLRNSSEYRTTEQKTVRLPPFIFQLGDYDAGKTCRHCCAFSAAML